MGPAEKVTVLAPVDKRAEARLLIDAGATELYGGMFPSYFSSFPAFLAPNQRTFPEAQLDEEGFAAVVGTARSRGVPVYLTINNLYFTDDQLPLILRMAKDAAAAGAAGFIMGSVPLILAVREAVPHVPVHLSTMGVALNHEAARFYEGLGIGRITLPRSLLLAEVREIVRRCPRIAFDSFILVGKCPNVEGFCSFLHTNTDKIWPCEQCYEVAATGDAQAPAAAVQKNWQGFPRSRGCGICAIPDLVAAGIRGLKLVGRGSPTAFKLANLGLLADAFAVLRDEPDRRAARERLKLLYASRFGHPCSSFACYFPEMGFGHGTP